jgi:hypothetical protein
MISPVFDDSKLRREGSYETRLKLFAFASLMSGDSQARDYYHRIVTRLTSG